MHLSNIARDHARKTNMVSVKIVKRKSTVLSPSNLSCLSQVSTINLTMGCAHNCVYCYACGYSVYPGDRIVTLYSNIPEKLKDELSRKKKQPQYVYFSPSSDLFQPLPEVQEICYQVLEVLLSKGIGVSFLSKGVIPERTLKLIYKHSDIVQAQIGLITVNESIRRIFEPDAAPIDVRLKQMKSLIDAGVAVQGRMAPIISGVTDSDDGLIEYFHKVSCVGIRRVAVSTLFLRPLIKRNLEKYITDRSMLDKIYNSYLTSPMQTKSSHSSIIPLPVSLRKRIYSRVQGIANDYGVNISICGCMNPDIGGICHINGVWPQSNEIQGKLFD